MKLTHQHLLEVTCKGDSRVMALNSYQFRLLGIVWPPRHGWIESLVGREIDLNLWRAVLDLKGVKTKQERQRILQKYGLNARTLFQTTPDKPIILKTAQIDPPKPIAQSLNL